MPQTNSHRAVDLTKGYMPVVPLIGIVGTIIAASIALSTQIAGVEQRIALLAQSVESQSETDERIERSLDEVKSRQAARDLEDLQQSHAIDAIRQTAHELDERVRRIEDAGQ